MSPIDLTGLAEKFENGLNTLLNNPEIKFKIWADAGEYQPYQRQDNTVIWFINGNLRRVTSSNDANDLVMGINGFALDFAIPVKRPRTNASQTESELDRIKNGQYPFVDYISNVINDYFEQAQVYTVTEGNSEYAVGFRAGTATTGVVDIIPVVGNCIQMSVFIELYYIQNGINSKQIKLTIDGNPVPFKAIRWGRAPMLEHDIQSGSLVSKSVATATAFSIDLNVPTQTGSDFDYVSEYLVGAKPNVAHFVTLDVAGTANTYFMTANDAQVSAEGISVPGTTISLMEVSDGYYDAGANHMGRFLVPNSLVKTITANIYYRDTPGVPVTAYVGGKCAVYPNNFSIDVTPGMVKYDKAANKYYVYIVFPEIVTVLNPKADGSTISYTYIS